MTEIPEPATTLRDELLAQADSLLADALDDIAEVDLNIGPRGFRRRMLAATLTSLRINASMALRYAAASDGVQLVAKPDRTEVPRPTPFLNEPFPAEPFPGPSALWIAELVMNHDCHLLTVQKANGAAGNPEAMVTCQTCDKRIPLP